MDEFKYEIDPRAYAMFDEPMFNLFRYKEYLCCIQRNSMFGTLNGYAAVDCYHPLYKHHFTDKVIVKDLGKIKFNNNFIGLMLTDPIEASANIVSLDMVIDVHCGLTYSDNRCPLIDPDIFPGLWWFGFDTNHSGDVMPFVISFAGRRMNSFDSYTYKSFAYVKREIKKLVEGLIIFEPQRSDIEETYIRYKRKKSLHTFAPL